MPFAARVLALAIVPAFCYGSDAYSSRIRNVRRASCQPMQAFAFYCTDSPFLSGSSCVASRLRCEGPRFPPSRQGFRKARGVNLLRMRDEQGSELAWVGTSRKVLSLAIPALASLCLDPLMGAVDSAFVGRRAVEGATEELAALAVASSLLTVSIFIFNFLSTATAPLVASVRAGGDREEGARLAGVALTWAAGIGMALALTLSGLAVPMTSIVTGGDVSESLASSAVDVLRLRCVGVPAALLATAANGAYRGLLDTRTPLLVVTAANILNFGLDIVLVPSHGAAGASVATATSEWAAALLFLRLLGTQQPSISLQPIPLRITSQASPLATASLFIFARTLALQLTLAAGTSAIARSADPASLATHQIAFQLLSLASFSADSLAIAAQTLVADASPSPRNTTNSAGDQKVQMTQAARNIALSSLGMGLGFGGMAGGALWVGRNFVISLFSSDLEVVRTGGVAVGLVACLLPVACMVYVGDGVMQGFRAFVFESKAMLTATALSVSAYAYLTASHAFGGDALFSVWASIYVLFLGRFVCFGYWWGTRQGIET